jgi:hypothetical protein
VVPRTFRLLTLGLFLIVATAAPALAGSTVPLTRAAMNAAYAPLDLVTAPVVAGMTTHRDVSKLDVSQKIGAWPAGMLWHTMINITASPARFCAGIAEIPFALISLGTDFDAGPFFNTEGVPALVDLPGVKFGITHITD